MSGTDSGNGLPSEPGALSAKSGLRPHLPEESKKPPHAATSRPRARRAHSPPPTKPFPSSFFTPSSYSGQRDSGISVSSYWSRSSRSSVNSGFSDSRCSTTSLESDRTTFSEAIRPIIIPQGLTAWRSPEEILRQYDVMLAKAQRPPDANLRGVHARELRARVAKLIESLKDSDPLVILHVTVNDNLPVCRRLDNDMINGTQLLYALAKGRCQRQAGDLVLKAEKQKHVVHSSDNPRLQGIWIPFERALGYANKVGAIEQLFPLFLEDLMPEIGQTDIQNKVEEFLIEESDIGSVVKNAVMVKNESLVRYDRGSKMEEDESPESNDIGSKAMAELSLKEDDFTKEDGKLPIPSIAHVLACKDAPENEGLPASRPLSTSTSTTTQSTSDASTLSNDETTAPSTIELRELLLTRLMDYFFSVFSSTPLRRVQHHPDGSSSSSARPGSTTSLGQPPIDPTRTNTNKRRKISGDGNGQDGEDDDLSKRKSQDRTSDHLNLSTKRRLACPYFKNNPRKFQEERSCCGPGWWTVHRVKEHLYRNHAMPLHCLRCHQVFSSNLELEEHSRRPDPTEQCMLNPDLPSFLQGRFNSDQEKFLRSRRRTLPKDASEEEKWVAVYRILFPAEDPASIPSPYYELQDDATLRPGDGDEDTASQNASELERYESFLRRELPVHVRRELEVRINETLFPLEESLRGQLVDIVRDVQLNLYEAYKASRAENDGLHANTEAPAGSGIDLEESGTVDNGADIDIDVTGGTSNIDPAQNVWFAGRAESSTMTAGMGLDDELAAFRPAEPYAEQSLGDFEGLLFDFPGPVPGSGFGVADFLTTMEGHDSGYGGSSTGCSDVVGSGWAW